MDNQAGNSSSTAESIGAVGRIPEISDDEVLVVIEKLEGEGRRLSAYAIKKALSNRGNAERYRNLLERYLANKQVTHAEPVQELPIELQEQFATLSSALTQQLLQLAKTLNHRAVTTAEQRVSAAIKGAREDVEMVRAELREADQENQDLEVKIAQLNELLTHSELKNKHQQEQIAQLSHDKQQIAQSLAEESQKRVTLEAHLEHVRSELQHDRAEVTRLTTTLADALTEKKSAQEAAKKWEAKAGEYEQARDTYQSKLMEILLKDEQVQPTEATNTATPEDAPEKK